MILEYIRKYGHYLVVGTIVIWTAVSFRADFAKVSFGPLSDSLHLALGSLLCFLTSYVVRGLRWHFFIAKRGHNVPFWHSLRSFIAGFAFTLSPGRVGEMIRYRYYKQYGVGSEDICASFFVERLLDVAVLGALCVASYAASSKYQNVIYGALVACFVSVLLITKINWLSFLDENDKSFTSRLKVRVVRLFNSMGVLLSFRHLAIGLGFGFCAWLLEGAGLMAIGQIFLGDQFSFQMSISIFTVALVIGTLSFMPGGLGSTEAVMVFLLTSMGNDLPTSISVTVTYRFMTLWFAVLIGWISVHSLRNSNK